MKSSPGSFSNSNIACQTVLESVSQTDGKCIFKAALNILIFKLFLIVIVSFFGDISLVFTSRTKKNMRKTAKEKTWFIGSNISTKAEETKGQVRPGNIF